MLIASIIMLLIVLVVGSSVNGASRAGIAGAAAYSALRSLPLPPFCYLANYLARKVDEVRNNLRGFLKPMGVDSGAGAVLLLAQPDLDTVVALFVTTLAMLFRRGEIMAVHRHYRMGISAVILLTAEPYRIRRVTLVLGTPGRSCSAAVISADAVADGFCGSR